MEKRIIVGLILALFLFFTIVQPLFAMGVPVPSIAPIADNDRTILPDNFPIYTNGTEVMNHPKADYVEKILPTNNQYKNNPGCYIACYSTSSTGSVYPTGNAFVIGQVRVAGSYDGGTSCVPTGYEDKKIKTNPTFVNLCALSFPVCKNKHCFAGANTGGWFAD